MNAASALGLTLTRMEEPPPPPGFLDQASHYRDAATIPRLLVLILTKTTGAASVPDAGNCDR